MHILLAEDSQANRMLLEAILTLSGHRVSMVENGREAVERVSREHFDLILMDVDMPELDGIEATRRIRALPSPTGELPIIAMTGHSHQNELRACREAGMNEHLGKPLDQARLLELLARYPTADQAVAAEDNQPEPETAPVSPVDTPAEEKILLQTERIQQLMDDTPTDVLPAVLKGFSEEIKLRQQSITELLQARESPGKLQHEVHTLKSLAATLGTLALREQAKCVEFACKEEKLEQAWREAEHLSTLVDDSLRALGEYCLGRQPPVKLE